MSIYKLPITDLFNMGTEVFDGVDVGDEIITQGYYHIDDGGGARFRVEQGLAAEGSCFEYTLVNTEDKQLKAVMIIENGTVNIDQLGAKGDAVLPEETVYNSTYRQNTFRANTGAKDNSPIITAALNREDICIVMLSPGKIYGVKSTINYSGNIAKKICSSAVEPASLLEIASISTDIMKFTSSATVNIKNLKFYKFSGNSAIGFVDAESVRMRDLMIKSLCDGIRFYDTSVKACTANIRDVQIFANYNGIRCNNLSHSVFFNVSVSPANTNLSRGIYLYDYNYDNTFTRCAISCNTGNGRSGIGISVSVNNDRNIFDRITIENTDVATSVSGGDIIFSKIAANNSNKAVSFAIALNITFDKCSFRDTYVTDVYMYSLQSENIRFNDCLFESRSTWFDIKAAVNEEAHDTFFFNDCIFRLTDMDSTAVSPSIIYPRETLNAAFDNCLFEVNGYPLTESNSDSVAALFYFAPFENGKDLNWSFDNCRFFNNTKDSDGNIVTLNSPIWVDLQNADSTTVSVRNSSFKGFRWITRICTSTETSAVPCKDEEGNIVPQTGVVKINPAFGGYPDSDIIEEAQRLFTAKQRYLSYDNWYLFDTLTPGVNTTYYKKAEEYGLS